MKLFISWAKNNAGAFAAVLHEWIKPVSFGRIETWCSVDLPPGSGSVNKILDGVKTSTACLAIITNESVNAPWLNFETGGFLGNTNPEKPVYAILCGDLTHISLATAGHPLSANAVNFTAFNEKDIGKLIKHIVNDDSLNLALDKSVRDNFPALQAEYDKIFNAAYLSMSSILAKDTDK